MRKIIILSFIILAVACSKEKNEPTTEIQKYTVNFALSGLKGQINDVKAMSLMASTSRKSMTANSSNPFEIVPYIDLLIYDNNGKLVAELNEQCCGTTNELYVENLEIGKYTAVAIGYWELIKDELFSLSAAKVSFASNSIKNRELFLEKVGFEVKAIENNKVNLLLKRKVGLLKVDLTDTPPADVLEVRAVLHDVARSFHLDKFMPLTNDVHQVYTSGIAELGHLGGYFMVANNNQSYKTSLELQVYGLNGELLKSKLIEDVTVGMNIKTTVRGKLFEPNPQGFTIEIDTEWDGENTLDF